MRYFIVNLGICFLLVVICWIVSDKKKKNAYKKCNRRCNNYMCMEARNCEFSTLYEKPIEVKSENVEEGVVVEE